MINNMKNEHNYVEACKNDYLRLNDRMRLILIEFVHLGQKQRKSFVN